MGDGSTCKQRSSCSSQGSTVKNTQCGGAKNVTIVYPSGQSGDKVPKASSTCGVTIPTVSFDCSSAQSTTTKYTKTSSTQIQTSSVATTPGQPSATGPTGGKPSSPAETGPKPSFPVGPSGPGSNTAPVASQTPPTPSSPANATTIESITSAESTSAESTVEISSSVESTTYEITSTAITSFETTSTVYSTSIQTITSCGPEVVSCPAGVSEGQTATTTVVSPILASIFVLTLWHTRALTQYPGCCYQHHHLPCDCH